MNTPNAEMRRRMSFKLPCCSQRNFNFETLHYEENEEGKLILIIQIINNDGGMSFRDLPAESDENSQDRQTQNDAV